MGVKDRMMGGGGERRERGIEEREWGRGKRRGERRERGRNERGREEGYREKAENRD